MLLSICVVLRYMYEYIELEQLRIVYDAECVWSYTLWVLFLFLSFSFIPWFSPKIVYGQDACCWCSDWFHGVCKNWRRARLMGTQNTLLVRVIIASEKRSVFFHKKIYRAFNMLMVHLWYSTRMDSVLHCSTRIWDNLINTNCSKWYF